MRFLVGLGLGDKFVELTLILSLFLWSFYSRTRVSSWFILKMLSMYSIRLFTMHSYTDAHSCFPTFRDIFHTYKTVRYCGTWFDKECACYAVGYKQGDYETRLAG